ncbi:hypothetical protein LSTR_LSTR007341 [Laodelphax striatellus]|uniref:Transcription cofactor vestigial-like protein 4 n=1 Tax=Laodelphax striatellus TaxID=195883 RepID=A0A482WT36_LAOST|nr:hypothetical protein LSTR_LSTR007341 [Laodelphax striatellus]
MDSSTTESPLDVLSRAATMLQDNAPLPPSYDEARFHLKCKEMAAVAATNGGKWKRERRSRPATATPPAYPLKTAQISQHPEPIDMSTRKIRGSPPSYSQTISAGYINRPPTTTNSPITPTPTTNNNSVTIEADTGTAADLDSSMPVIDEHFRRSLGKHYQSVFSSSATPTSAASAASASASASRPRITSNGHTTDDSSSDSADNARSALSVDEHFAKALGETWLKLQQKEKSMTNGNSSSLSSSSSSSSTMTITTTTNAPLVLVPSSVSDHALLRVNRIEP